MIKKIKSMLCNHYYHELHSYEDDIDETVGYELGNKYVIYCHKCKDEKTVLEKEFKTIMARQSIDSRYSADDKIRKGVK